MCMCGEGEIKMRQKEDINGVWAVGVSQNITAGCLLLDIEIIK